MIANNPMSFLSSRGVNNNSMSMSTSTGSNQMSLGFSSMIQNNPHTQFPSINPNNQMFSQNQMSLNTPGSSGSSANSFLSPPNPVNPSRNYFLQSPVQNEPSLFSTNNSNQNKQINNNKKKGTVRISWFIIVLYYC